MFDTREIDDLDAEATCDALATAQRELVRVEIQQLRLAAHWLDLHAPVEHPDAGEGIGGRALPGTERIVSSGADGTPEVGEFAAAEFAALQDMHPAAGAALLAKVANLRHRHPILWQRVLAGEVRAWKALETARLVARSDQGQAPLSLAGARLVDQQTSSWIDTLPWAAYLDLVIKRIIAADPRRAEAVRLSAEAEQFVTTGQSSEHGLKTFVARARAGDVIYLAAVVDRIAELLAVRGDTRPLGPRRASALALLAHPAHALAMLASGLTSDAEITGPPEQPAGSEATSSEGSMPSYLDLPPELLTRLQDLLGRIDLERLLPRATLHVHLGQDTVAAAEGIGPITLTQAREWLGHHRVTLRPVLDPSSVAAVNGYSFPTMLRAAVQALTPRDVFPFAVNEGRGKDIDHAAPYLPPARGGPPGQTGLHNAAPMVRHHHRLKTHGGWELTQLATATYLWRSPHGHFWVVDPTGTYRLPSAAGAAARDAVRAVRSAA